MDPLRECQLIGLSLLEIQQVEFALYGIISHLTHLPEGKGWKFKGLSPETFLRGNPNELNATLGQLESAFGVKLYLTNDDFKILIKDRNLIAHNYWRMSRTSIKGAKRLENPEKFLLDFIDKCQYWKKVINGLLAFFILTVAKKESREHEVKLDQKQQDELNAYLHHIQTVHTEKR